MKRASMLMLLLFISLMYIHADELQLATTSSASAPFEIKACRDFQDVNSQQSQDSCLICGMLFSAVYENSFIPSPQYLPGVQVQVVQAAPSSDFDSDRPSSSNRPTSAGSSRQSVSQLPTPKIKRSASMNDITKLQSSSLSGSEFSSGSGSGSVRPFFRRVNSDVLSQSSRVRLLDESRLKFTDPRFGNVDYCTRLYTMIQTREKQQYTYEEVDIMRRLQLRCINILHDLESQNKIKRPATFSLSDYPSREQYAIHMCANLGCVSCTEKAMAKLSELPDWEEKDNGIRDRYENGRIPAFTPSEADNDGAVFALAPNVNFVEDVLDREVAEEDAASLIEQEQQEQAHHSRSHHSSHDPDAESHKQHHNSHNHNNKKHHVTHSLSQIKEKVHAATSTSTSTSAAFKKGDPALRADWNKPVNQRRCHPINHIPVIANKGRTSGEPCGERINKCHQRKLMLVACGERVPLADGAAGTPALQSPDKTSYLPLLFLVWSDLTRIQMSLTNPRVDVDIMDKSYWEGSVLLMDTNDATWNVKDPGIAPFADLHSLELHHTMGDATPDGRISLKKFTIWSNNKAGLIQLHTNIKDFFDKTLSYEIKRPGHRTKKFRVPFLSFFKPSSQSAFTYEDLKTLHTGLLFDPRRAKKDTPTAKIAYYENLSKRDTVWYKYREIIERTEKYMRALDTYKDGYSTTFFKTYFKHSWQKLLKESETAWKSLDSECARTYTQPIIEAKSYLGKFNEELTAHFETIAGGLIDATVRNSIRNQMLQDYKALAVQYEKLIGRSLANNQKVHAVVKLLMERVEALWVFLNGEWTSFSSGCQGSKDKEASKSCYAGQSIDVPDRPTFRRIMGYNKEGTSKSKPLLDNLDNLREKLTAIYQVRLKLPEALSKFTNQNIDKTQAQFSHMVSPGIDIKWLTNQKHTTLLRTELVEGIDPCAHHGRNTNVKRGFLRTQALSLTRDHRSRFRRTYDPMISNEQSPPLSDYEILAAFGLYYDDLKYDSELRGKYKKYRENPHILPWKSGKNQYNVNDDAIIRKEDIKYGNYFVTADLTFPQWLDSFGLPTMAGVSGTTGLILRIGQLLGLTEDDMYALRLALIAWMVPVEDHTMGEILTAAESFGLEWSKYLKILKGVRSPTPFKYQNLFSHLLPLGDNGQPRQLTLSYQEAGNPITISSADLLTDLPVECLKPMQYLTDSLVRLRAAQLSYNNLPDVIVNTKLPVPVAADTYYERYTSLMNRIKDDAQNAIETYRSCPSMIPQNMLNFPNSYVKTIYHYMVGTVKHRDTWYYLALLGMELRICKLDTYGYEEPNLGFLPFNCKIKYAGDDTTGGTGQFVSIDLKEGSWSITKAVNRKSFTIELLNADASDIYSWNQMKSDLARLKFYLDAFVDDKRKITFTIESTAPHYIHPGGDMAMKSHVDKWVEAIAPSMATNIKEENRAHCHTYFMSLATTRRSVPLINKYNNVGGVAGNRLEKYIEDKRGNALTWFKKLCDDYDAMDKPDKKLKFLVFMACPRLDTTKPRPPVNVDPTVVLDNTQNLAIKSLSVISFFEVENGRPEFPAYNIASETFLLHVSYATAIRYYTCADTWDFIRDVCRSTDCIIGNLARKTGDEELLKEFPTVIAIKAAEKAQATRLAAKERAWYETDEGKRFAKLLATQVDLMLPFLQKALLTTDLPWLPALASNEVSYHGDADNSVESVITGYMNKPFKWFSSTRTPWIAARFANEKVGKMKKKIKPEHKTDPYFVITRIESTISGRDISVVSDLAHEEEILFPKGSNELHRRSLTARRFEVWYCHHYEWPQIADPDNPTFEDTVVPRDIVMVEAVVEEQYGTHWLRPQAP